MFETAVRLVFRTLSCVAIVMTLTGCEWLKGLPQGNDPKLESTFDRLNAAIERRDADFLRSQFAPEAIDADFDDRLRATLESLPKGTALSRERAIYLSTLHSLSGEDARSLHTVAYQTRFPQAWALVTIDLRSEGDSYRMTRLGITPLRDDLRKLSSFWSAPDTILHWSVLLAALVCILLSLSTLVIIVVRRKDIRRPALWFLFVLVGVGGVSMNWTTGDLAYSMFRVGVPVVSMTRHSEFVPWTIVVGLPLGALLFWYRYPAILNPPSHGRWSGRRR